MGGRGERRGERERGWRGGGAWERKSAGKYHTVELNTRSSFSKEKESSFRTFMYSSR
jgi:hypothetical protein